VELLRSKFKGANNGSGNNNSGSGKDGHHHEVGNVRFRDLAGGLEAWAMEVDASFPRY